MVFRNSPRQPLSRPGFEAPNPGGGGGGGGGMLQRLLGNRMPRYNRFMDKLGQGSVIWKVPRDFGADEYNVVMGLGRTAIAAGATATITLNAPRDLIIRRLTASDAAAPANVDWTVNAIAVEGNATVLVSGAGGNMFLPNVLSPLEFDLPVAGGTPVAVTITNTSAAGVVIVGGFAID